MANFSYGSKPKLATFKAYARGGAFPLDLSSVFNSVEELNAYISESGSIAYAGQIVAVANGTVEATNGQKEYDVYLIRSDKSLQKIGTNKNFESVTAANAFLAANSGISFAGEIITILNGTKYELYTVGSDNTITRMSFDASSDVPVESPSFASVVVGDKTIEANAVSSGLSMIAGDNVTLTADVDADSITIAAGHQEVEVAEATTAESTPDHEGTVTVVTEIIRDEFGHATGYEKTTITLPDNEKALSELTDAEITDITDGEVLVYDAASGKWINKTYSEAKIVDTDALAAAIAANDAMQYKGTIDGAEAAPGTFTPAAENGNVYKVATAGYVNGIKVEVGDMLICNADGTVEANAENLAEVAAKWDVIQTNIDGYVVGPESAVAGNVVTFDGVTGKLIKDSGLTIEKSVPADAVFTDTTYEQFTAGEAGLVPAGGETEGFLKNDGTWAMPEYPEEFAGSAAGLVPAATTEDAGKFLQGDGTWAAPVTSLEGLTDTEVTEVSEGEVLVFDSASGKWINKTLGEADILAKSEFDEAFTDLNVLAKLKNVDGAGSGLDADTLDGMEASDFATKVDAALEGAPTAPTAAEGTNNTQIATTAFVQKAVSSAVLDATITVDADRALISDADGKVSVSETTATEIGYLAGVTSGVQEQLDAKAPLADPAFTGVPTAPTAVVGTDTKQVATTEFVNDAIEAAFAANDAMEYMGVIDGTAAAPGAFTPAAENGHTYKVATAGYVNGVKVEVGDMLICLAVAEAATADNYSEVMANWNVIQTNIDGAVITKDTATTVNDIVVYASTNGGTVASSGVGITALEASKVMVANADGDIATSEVTTDELAYLAGVTSGVQGQLDAKADAENAALTGVPTAPTAVEGTNSTQIATTEFVTTAVKNATPIVVSETEPADLATGGVWFEVVNG